MEQKNRVYTLYRVSTLGQVEKDDIPMQKQRCREFAETQGWEIVKEFSEKGVSGFKVSAKDRDAIQEIQADALKGKFDILLVFMFDRLGRRDDETPFVVEWFVKSGIEVWSAMEGQQRFDTHVDKLMNYIRYWQASGESLKTSMRVKTRMSQLTEAGCYTGGSVPFGYRAVKKGRINKKNREVYDLEIDEAEAEIVKLIFHKYVHEGYGAMRLCRYLHEQGITNKNGAGFPNTTLNRIIKNVIYTGILKNGDTQSEYIDELKIIDVETYSRAQEIMRQRTRQHSDVPLNSKGKSSLVGNVYCGHCGGKLTLTTSGRKRTRVDGTVHYEPRIRYQCHYNVRHPGECDGQSGYGVTKLDAIVEKIIRMKFSELKAVSESELLESQQEREIELAKAKHEMANTHYQAQSRELEDLRAETIKVIRGESKLNAELLNSLVEDASSRAQEAEAALTAAKEELDACIETNENIKREYDQILNWADLYDNSTYEAKKMIASQFIKAVRVYRDYELEIDLNISFEDFQSFHTSEQTLETPTDEAVPPEAVTEDKRRTA